MSEDIGRNPEVRVRVKHTQTTKGWRLDETTVEITKEGYARHFGERFFPELMKKELELAYEQGLAETNRRNLREGHDL